MSSYSEKLKHPNWQRKRLEILERDNYTCQLCSATQSTLHIHHKRYVPNREPWEYEDENFITYCEDCHKMIESLKNINYTVISITKIKYGSTIYYNSLAQHGNDPVPLVLMFRFDPKVKKIEIFATLDETNLQSLLKLIEYGKILAQGV